MNNEKEETVYLFAGVFKDFSIMLFNKKESLEGLNKELLKCKIKFPETITMWDIFDWLYNNWENKKIEVIQ